MRSSWATSNTEDLQNKLMLLYSKGLSTRDIQDILFKIGDLFVVFVAGIERRALWTTYTRKLLRETESFKFLIQEGGYLGACDS